MQILIENDSKDLFHVNFLHPFIVCQKRGNRQLLYLNSVDGSGIYSYTFILVRNSLFATGCSFIVFLCQTKLMLVYTYFACLSLFDLINVNFLI